jgi:hypothetical protein
MNWSEFSKSTFYHQEPREDDNEEKFGSIPNWQCMSDSYDEETGMCTADGEQCRGFNCPYEQYVSE